MKKMNKANLQRLRLTIFAAYHFQQKKGNYTLFVSVKKGVVKGIEVVDKDQDKVILSSLQEAYNINPDNAEQAASYDYTLHWQCVVLLKSICAGSKDFSIKLFLGEETKIFIYPKLGFISMRRKTHIVNHANFLNGNYNFVIDRALK